MAYISCVVGSNPTTSTTLNIRIKVEIEKETMKEYIMEMSDEALSKEIQTKANELATLVNEATERGFNATLTYGGAGNQVRVLAKKSLKFMSRLDRVYKQTY